jgi:putative cardiolipin synthase
MSPLAAQADQIRYVSHGENSLAAFIDIIQNAKKSISLTTFIFEPCHASTQVVMDALEAKARTGVKVHVLLDNFMQSTRARWEITTYLQARGIEVRWFNTSLINTNFRTHIKLIVADGSKYITGGRNIADDYFGLYDGANFIDRDAYVEGASGKDAQQAFDRMWNSNWTTQIKGSTITKIKWAQSCGYDESERVAEIKNHLKRYHADLIGEMPVRTCGDTRFYADEPGAKILYQHDDGVAAANKEGKHVTAEFLKFIRGTKKRLVLENWSMMPHENMAYEFFDLRWKKIPVVAIVNDNMDGPGILKYAEDSFNNRASHRQNKGTMKVPQVSMNGDLHDFWKMTPEGALFRLHGKTAVRDGKDVLITSFNIDNRSYSLNMESMVIAHDCPALVADLDQGYTDLLETYHKDVAAGIPPNDPDSFLWTLLGALGSSFF